MRIDINYPSYIFLFRLVDIQRIELIMDRILRKIINIVDLTDLYCATFGMDSAILQNKNQINMCDDLGQGVNFVQKTLKTTRVDSLINYYSIRIKHEVPTFKSSQSVRCKIQLAMTNQS